MVTTRPPKTIVKPTALGPVANTDTKLLIYGLFQKGRVLAQDGVLSSFVFLDTTPLTRSQNTDSKLLIYGLFQKGRVLAQDGIKTLPRQTSGSPVLVSTAPSSFGGMSSRAAA